MTPAAAASRPATVAAGPGRSARSSGGEGPAGGSGSGRIELTRRGWSALGAATGLATAGRMLGVVELWIVAVSLVALLVAGVVWALLNRPSVTIRRSLRPAVARVGDAAAAVLTVSNPTDRSLPATDVVEPVGDGRSVRIGFAPVDPLGSGRTTYRLPTDRRGVHRLGPGVVTVTDPFGLVSRSGPAGRASRFTVGPRVHPVEAPPPSPGLRPGSRPPPRAALGRSAGGDFRNLRDYETGDDLRLVHWRSTARAGVLMVRQDQPEDHPLVCIAVDVRPGAHDPATFEVACEAVASVAGAARAAGQGVRILTTAGDDLLPRHGTVGDELGPALAALEPGGPAGPERLAVTVDELRRSAPWARHVVVSGRLGPDGGGALARAAAGPLTSPWLLVAASEPDAPIPGAVVVDAGGGRFAESWNRAIATWAER